LLKTLDALALELAAENWEPVRWDPDGVEHQIRAAFVAFRTAKEAGGTKEYGRGNVALTVAALEQVLQNLRRIESARTQKAAVSVAKHSAAWQIDWPLCIQSFKQPLCGIITGWLVLSWGWETPMPAVLSAVIVYQPTLGASYRRVIMRLAGAMIGAMMTLTAMIWILPNFQSAGVMAIVLGMVMTICAYLYFSSERYNYIGMQAGFVVAITLVTGYQITGDLDPMWSRLQGILLAGLVVALVSRWFFPVRSSAVLVKILRQWLAAIRTVSAEALNAASERKGISALRTAWGGMGRVDQLLVESAAESHAPIFRSRLLPDYARLLERLTVHLLAQPSPRADTSKLIDGFAAEPAIALRTACDTLLTEASNAVAGTPHRVQNATVALDAAAAGLRERMSELRENRSCMQSSDEAITAFFAWMQEAITMAARLRDLAGATCRLEAATRLISDVEKKAPMPAMQPASA